MPVQPGDEHRHVQPRRRPGRGEKKRKIVVKAQKAGTVRLRGCGVKSGTPDCGGSNNRLGSTEAESSGGVGPETTAITDPAYQARIEE